MTQRATSLAEQIAEASSLAEIHALLAKGAEFKYATRRTENKWRKVAMQRKIKLQSRTGGK